MTNSQIFRHLKQIKWSPSGKAMNLREDERTHYREREMLDELHHRGFTDEAIEHVLKNTA